VTTGDVLLRPASNGGPPPSDGGGSWAAVGSSGGGGRAGGGEWRRPPRWFYVCLYGHGLKCEVWACPGALTYDG
jgi:hypothetical protein